MKVREHVENLLRKGRKPRERVELGFPKSVVTRVRGQLTEAKATPRAEMPQRVAQAERYLQTLAQLPEQVAAMQQKLWTLEGEPQKIDGLLKGLSEVEAPTAAAQQVGTYTRQICPYEKDDVCTLKKAWPSEDETPHGVAEPLLVEDEKPDWHIRPSSFHRAMYIAPLEIRSDDTESEVASSPLSGAEYQVTCTACDSRSWIAARTKCPRCGGETYWSWFPK
jgi:hypothetical protein